MKRTLLQRLRSWRYNISVPKEIRREKAEDLRRGRAYSYGVCCWVGDRPKWYKMAMYLDLKTKQYETDAELQARRVI